MNIPTRIWTRVLAGAAVLTLTAIGAKAEVAIVYPSADAVLKGQSYFGTSTSEGIVITAEQALAANTKPLIALPQGTLHYGTLLKLDNQLNAALFSLGEEVTSEDLQKAHTKRAAALQAFLPSSASTETMTGSGVNARVVASTEPFVVKINGKYIDDGPVVLVAHHGLSDAKLEIVRNAVDPVWKISVRLESDPKLLFWRKGARQTMNDVPSSKFRNDHQLLFAPMSLGGIVPMSLEISSVKANSYIWTLKVDSKKGSIEKKFPVTFQ